MRSTPKTYRSDKKSGVTDVTDVAPSGGKGCSRNVMKKPDVTDVTGAPSCNVCNVMKKSDVTAQSLATTGRNVCNVCNATKNDT